MLAVRDVLLSRLCGQAWPHEPLLGALNLSPTLDVLDVGAGDGRLLRWLRDQGHSGELVGLDPVPGANIVRGSADALPFPDASFDVALFVRVLAHLPDPEKALQETRRVLRPDGQIVVAAHGPRHLQTTWTALIRGATQQAESIFPALRVPIRVTVEDAQALAQSYGENLPIAPYPFAWEDVLELTTEFR